MRLFHNLFKKYCFCIGSGYESYDDTDDETETTWFVYDALVKDIRASSVPKRLFVICYGLEQQKKKRMIKSESPVIYRR